MGDGELVCAADAHGKGAAAVDSDICGDPLGRIVAVERGFEGKSAGIDGGSAGISVAGAGDGDEGSARFDYAAGTGEVAGNGESSGDAERGVPDERGGACERRGEGVSCRHRRIV